MSGSPTYPLEQVRDLIERAEYHITSRARNDAHAIGYDEDDVVACVLGLTLADFYKTMPSAGFPGRMQDLYRPIHQGRTRYVKLQIVASARGAALAIISFKDR